MAFDDDDGPLAGTAANNGACVSAEESLEDEMPDYKLFMSMFEKKGVSSKMIRKGEKDFESHGTRAQDGALESSRAGMEDVLSYTRIHRGEGWVRAWYFPDWWPDDTESDGIWARERVVVVEHERGSWMKSMGRTIPGDRSRAGVGRLWLLPEEALYMVERGSMDLWWPDMDLAQLLPASTTSEPRPQASFGPDDYEPGLPLSLEAAYSLLAGFEGQRGKISLAKYQVYSHLRRSGYIVLRATSPQGEGRYDNPPSSSRSQEFLQWLFPFLFWDLPWTGSSAGFGPLVSPGRYRAYRPIFRQLATIPRHKPTARPPQDRQQAAPSDAFRVFYHVWKPGGGASFSKKSPPTPDFRIAVADAEDTEVPSLEQIDALLASTPYDPPNPLWQGPGKMYQRLKHGHRNVLVAVVDGGLVNFVRFGEGAFAEERLSDRFDHRVVMRGGKKGGRGRGRGRGRGKGGGRR